MREWNLFMHYQGVDSKFQMEVSGVAFPYTAGVQGPLKGAMNI